MHQSGKILRQCIRQFSASSSKTQVRPKTAVLMLNMGGPQNTDQVPDYLLRIMTDRDMIQLPVQGQLGPYIARRRTPEVQKKYAEIGGGSPIFKWTNIQGELMCQKLDLVSPQTAPHKHYVAFRYVDPLTESALDQIQKEGAERVVIFSQYPQYSCATSGSSMNAIYTYFKNKPKPMNIKWSVIDRWPVHPLLAKTFADRITTELKQFPEEKQKEVVILFSAHSLPLKAVNRGDPYPGEVGATVQLVMQELNYCNPYCLVWQSKVGPLPWLEPYTDDAIRVLYGCVTIATSVKRLLSRTLHFNSVVNRGLPDFDFVVGMQSFMKRAPGYVKQGKKNFILVPIAFVNEHIETLHEMDIEYCHDLGKELHVENMRRAAAPNDHPLFISALTDIVASHLKGDHSVSPKFLIRCPHCSNSRCHESKKFFAELCA